MRRICVIEITLQCDSRHGGQNPKGGSLPKRKPCKYRTVGWS